MECDEVVQNLEAYNARELSEGERTHLAEHLARCTDCERERRELLTLAAELRSAGDSFRALRPFTVAAAPSQPSRRRPWLIAAGAAAAVWLILLTAAAFWPSFAERLSFLPVGRRLSQVTTTPSPTTTPASGDGYSLSDAPDEALAAVNSLFQPSETRLPSEDVLSAELSKLLPADVGQGASSARVISVGPVRSVNEADVRLIVTVDFGRDHEREASEPHRYRLLLTVARSPKGGWRVSELQKLAD